MDDVSYNLDWFANVPKRKDLFLTSTTYNSNSNHTLGQNAFKILNESDNLVKKLFDYRYDIIEFVPGGGSLANERAILDNKKIKYHISSNNSDPNIIMISSIEHSSISKYITQSLVDRGYIIIIIPVTQNGIINLDEFAKLLDQYCEKIAIISCMLVNNEIGTIQPIKEMLHLTKLKNNNIIFHSDISCAVGLFNKYFENNIIYPDIITLSAYKFGGPHYGIILSSKKLRLKVQPTPDVENIANTAICLEKYLSEFNKHNDKNKIFKQFLKSALFEQLKLHTINYICLDTMDTMDTINTASVTTADNIISFIIPFLKASVFQKALSDNKIYIGSGSACTTNVGSHTLKSMGYNDVMSQQLFRLSFNFENLFEENSNISNCAEYLANKISNVIINTINENKFLLQIENSSTEQTKSTEPVKVVRQIPTTKIILPSVRSEVKFSGLLDTPLSDRLLVDTIVLTFSELSLKGTNQDSFIEKLKTEILYKLNKRLDQPDQSNIINFKLKKMRNMFLIKLDKSIDITDYNLVNLIKKLSLTAGISYVIPMTTIKSTNAEEICYELANIYNYKKCMISNNPTNSINQINQTDILKTNNTFKTNAKIYGKYLDKSSKDWEYFVGQYIKDRFGDAVVLDEKKCDIILNVFYDNNTFYSYVDKFSGLFGLPSGSEGKINFLVWSENYNRSTLAIFEMVKRGVVPIVYFFDNNNNTELYNQLKNFTSSFTNQSQTNLISVNSNQNFEPANLAELLNLIDLTNSKHLIVEPNDHNQIDTITNLKLLKNLSNQFDINIFNVTELMTGEKISQISQTNISNQNKKGLVLISGGIDSPIASVKLTNKNMIHDYVHFISDLNDNVSMTKITNIIKRINSSDSIVYFVEFGKLQKKIAESYKSNYRVMLYKIFMILISNKIAIQHNYSYICMGNSWGQVASQTPENLYITNKFSELPILCPLISYNKNDIINEAYKSNTYELSICDGNDCCVLYLPKNPVLNAKYEYIKFVIDDIGNYESAYEIVILHNRNIILSSNV